LGLLIASSSLGTSLNNRPPKPQPLLERGEDREAKQREERENQQQFESLQTRLTSSRADDRPASAVAEILNLQVPIKPAEMPLN
jgi:hypothetical protein